VRNATNRHDVEEEVKITVARLGTEQLLIKEVRYSIVMNEKVCGEVSINLN